MTNLPTFLIKCESVKEAQAIRRGIAEYTSHSYTSGNSVTYQSDNAATVRLVALMLKTHWPRLEQEAAPVPEQENRISPAQIGVMPTTPACKGKILMPESERENRITIETQSLEDSHAVANTIGHLITSIMIGEKAISFKLYDNVGYMDVAKLLATRGPRVVIGGGNHESDMVARGYLPCHRGPSTHSWDEAPDWATQIVRYFGGDGLLYWYNDVRGWGAAINTPSIVFNWAGVHPVEDSRVFVEERPKAVPVEHIHWPENHNSMDLATQMAWLEGFSVVGECTGRRWCEILNPERSTVEHIKYDPIGRAAIRQHLIEKYQVDLNWLAGGVCMASIFGDNTVSTEEFGGCLGSAIVQTILNSK